jgi:hypothetical protein
MERETHEKWAGLVACWARSGLTGERCQSFPWNPDERGRRLLRPPYFEESSLFEYRMFDGGAQGGWHGAVCFSLLHGPPENTISNLPPGYSPSNWKHSK